VDVELQIGALTLVREIPEIEYMCFRSTMSRRRLDTGEALAAVSLWRSMRRTKLGTTVAAKEASPAERRTAG
jgi:hypothetical protein